MGHPADDAFAELVALMALRAGYTAPGPEAWARQNLGSPEAGKREAAKRLLELGPPGPEWEVPEPQPRRRRGT